MAEGRSVLVTLDKERHLRYNFNALADLEQVLGFSLASLPQQLDRLGLNTVRCFLWAGLKHEDATLTPARVGDLIQTYVVEQGSDVVALAAKMKEALELAGYGKPKAGESTAAPLATGSATPN